MCCLKYEQEAYENLISRTPNVGALVDTPMGRGTVVNTHLLRGMVSVKMNAETDAVVNEFKVDEMVIIKNTSRVARQGNDEQIDLKTLKELEQD